MPLRVSKSAAKTPREGLRRGKLQFLLINFSDSMYPLVIIPSYKNATNLYKKKGNICSFLLLEVSPPFSLLFLTLCILSETCTLAQEA